MTAAPAVTFRLVRPFHIEAVAHGVDGGRPGDVLLRPRLTGICGSDLKLYAGTRSGGALRRKLPLALLHEGVSEVVAGDGTHAPGTRVAVVPSIPCYLAFPERYPSKAEACAACRPGGAGESYCLDHLYLSSNADGLAQTRLWHPASLVLPVPSGVPDRFAVLTEPLATIAAACEKAPLRPGVRCLVLGDGALGQLVAAWLRGHHGVPREQIYITTHYREHRVEFSRLAGRIFDGARGESLRELRDRVDVVFECVGGASTEETLAQAIDCLRPGGTAVLLGPSEQAVPLNTREMIGKGLVFVGANRSFVPHFRTALARLEDRRFRRILEGVFSGDRFDVRSAEDLDRALFHAWTKKQAGKTIVSWACAG